MMMTVEIQGTVDTEAREVLFSALKDLIDRVANTDAEEGAHHCFKQDFKALDMESDIQVWFGGPGGDG